MKKNYTLTYISLFSIILLSACFNNQTRDTKPTHFVQKQGSVAPQIINLLELTNVQHNGELESIVKETQENWLRKPGNERWDIGDISYPNQQEIYEQLKQLKMFDTIQPTKKSYDYILILGALFSTMQLRMDYAIDLWNQGIRFNKIVLLAGARPAVTNQGENQDAFTAFAKTELESIPETEADMIKLVYDYSNMPEGMRKLPVQIINVPMLTKPDGALRRPNTADTIEWWLATNPLPGSVLAVSNQPYVEYQDAVLRSYLPQDFSIETVGIKTTEDKKLGVILDAIARTLYQEYQRLTAATKK